jgi:hypothetical protein
MGSNGIESNRIESNRIESNRIESNRIESNRIESNGTLSAAQLSLELADFNQQRSEQAGSRPLAFNSLVMGRTRKGKREKEREREGETAAGVGIEEGRDASEALKMRPSHDKVTEKLSFLTANTDTCDSQRQLLHRQHRQQQHASEPLCRIYKIDLTGNFYRCQAAAVGVGADAVEKWMGSRGSYLATKATHRLPSTSSTTTSASSSATQLRHVTGTSTGSVNTVDAGLYPAATAVGTGTGVGKSKGKGKGVEGGIYEEKEGRDGDSDGDVEMIECLGIAECCLREVYRVSDLSAAEVRVATLQGTELWG